MGILKNVGIIGDFEVAIQLKKLAGVNAVRNVKIDYFDQVNNATATTKRPDSFNVNFTYNNVPQPSRPISNL